MCKLAKYMFLLNISCQHLGDECNLGGFLVPFGHRVGGMYIFGIYVSWLNICLYWIYNANSWGMNVIWRVSLCPSVDVQKAGCSIELVVPKAECPKS